MKTVKLSVLFFILSITGTSFAQLDKPVFQLSLGLAQPLDELAGNSFITKYQFTDPNNVVYYYDAVDTNLFKDNLGAKTGFSLQGSAKINLHKYSIVRGVGFIAFNSFNTFETSRTGTQLRLLGGTYTPVPIKYDYSISTFSIGLGLEVAPTSFTDIISPYIGANVSFNSFSSSLDRIEGTRTDTNRFSASSFRIGVNFNAGIEAKLSPQFGLAVGTQYNLGNLLLKQSPNLSPSDDIYEWGRTNSTLYDGEGSYYSYLQNAIANNNNAPAYKSKDKKWNWASFYIALNFYPNALDNEKKK